MKKILLAASIIALALGSLACSSNGNSNEEPEVKVNGQKKTITVNGVKFNMIYVEGGTFQMGCSLDKDSTSADNERPVHQVTLNGFYIGETEVTWALWYAPDYPDFSSSLGTTSEKAVFSQTWADCQSFIEKLNKATGLTFRMPTEAEWEFAARGGTLSKGYRYAGSNNLDEVAWYEDNIGDDENPRQVAQKKPNELGIYDMSGNVAEWCSGWYGPYSSDAQTNPTGASTGTYRILRGGGIFGNDKCRVTSRDYCLSQGRRFTSGFRLVL